jgi:uncharacterized protein YdhG (YjbR/CyaY superfamily)
MATATSVDEYLAALPPEARTALERLRETIKAVAPEATETISYRMPAFKDQGRILVWYAAFTNHYSLFPATDALKETLGDELAPYLAGKGTIRFPMDAPLPTALVRRIVEVRLEENAAARRR